jgi:proteasome accessory factor C
MALRSHDRFEILKAVLAMAEEQDGVALSDAAAELSIGREALLSILSPMLHISFRAQTNDELIDTTYAFELDEDTDRLSVDQAHWLRDMRSLPPSPATAQRLVLAGLVVKGASSQPDPALDAALDKLEALSGDLVVFIPEPPFLEVVRDCVEEETPLRFTYAKSATAVSDRVIEPYKVFRQLGSWYVSGKEMDGETIKYFRVDRMLDAEMTKLPRFDPPEDVDVPDRMPIDHLLRDVTVRVPERLRNLLADDYSIDELRELDGGRIEVRVGVLGEERLDYLLLRLGPEAEWLEPELDARRAEAARTLLAVYEP